VDWNLIQAGYLSGKSTAQLGKEFGLSQTWIAERLRKMHTKMRPAKPYKQYSVDHTVFSTPLSEEAQYWLGFLLTDGSVVYPKGGNFLPKISLELQARDKSQVELFQDFIRSTYPLYYNKHVDAWRVCVASVELANVLAPYGFVQRKTRTVVVALDLLNSRHFWRGVIDGDGWIAEDGSFEVVSASVKFLQQFVQYVLTVSPSRDNRDGTVRATQLNVKTRKDGNFRVGTRSGTGYRLLTELYQPGDVALPRKMAIVDKIRAKLDTSTNV